MEGGGDQSNRVTPSTSDAVIAAADRLLLAAHAGDVDAVRCWTSLTTAAAARGVWAPPQGAGDLAGLAADRRAAAGAGQGRGCGGGRRGRGARGAPGCGAGAERDA